MAIRGKVVVSTRDGRTRTGVVGNTVESLIEVIDGYVDDGYALDELVIEGVTE